MVSILYPAVSKWAPDTGVFNMATKRIDAELVNAIKPGETVFDNTVRGFMVRHRGGSARYAVKTLINGRQTILSIGRHGPGAWSAERARREAVRLLGLIRDGKDVARERAEEKSAPLFTDFAARYLAEYSEPMKKPRTRVEDARLLRLHLLPAFGKMKVREITRSDVARFHTSKRAIPVGANRALALLSSILGWAEKVGERPDMTNPCRHVERYPEKERERLLTAPELARLGDALGRAAELWTDASKATWRDELVRQAEADGINDLARPAWIAARMPRRDTPEDPRAIATLRLLAFTGARLSEILTLQWAWIDDVRGLARLPDSKTGAKNLYLPPGALAVLADLPRFAGNPYVVPGDRPGSHFIGIQKPWQRLRALAGLKDVRIHDLRHAFASTAVAAGDSLFIVGKLLGHRQSSTTERYAHLAVDPARAAADRTGERVREMMQTPAGAGNIVQLPRAAG
jgi:integrase